MRSDRGFTLVEVLVAALMMSLIVGAMAAMFLHGSDASVATQRQSQMISIADQQIENIRGQVKTSGFNKLAMSGQPAALPGTITNSSYSSTLNADPNAFVKSVTGCGSSNEELLIESNFNNTGEGVPLNPANTSKSSLLPWVSCTNTGTLTGTGAQIGEPLQILSNGFVTPQQSLTVGTDTFVVDTYVTDTYVGCNSSGLGNCPTTSSGSVSCGAWPSTTASTTCGDARRVIVAVILKQPGYSGHARYDFGPTSPVYVSTVFTNPSPSNEPTSSIGFTIGGTIG
jgi:type II secretory pathway pseudopilin PulG